MRLYLLIMLLAVLAFGFVKESQLIRNSMAVQAVLLNLGATKPAHFITPDQEQVRMGREIVLNGFTTNLSGKKSKRISKYYVCTTCHNIEQEDPDLRVSNPETRLDYVITKRIPFLQGSTFKGIVNRESWYNDDYVKKYGDEKIQLAHNDLRESIQLCAIECSQGRPMDDWEIEAVLAYYWSLELTIGDLNLSAQDEEIINRATLDTTLNTIALKRLKGYYLQKSPAHFFDAPADKNEGYENLIGNPINGEKIYESSCLHCHKPDGVSHYVLENTPLDLQHLQKMIPKNSHFSIYQIIAYGTYAIPGHKPYMPHYPVERMSKQQVEDLRAFIESK